MKFDLRETAREHRIVVSHRGVTGGNIPCNTLPAYKIALLEGAHMLETDVSTTCDGELVIFHPPYGERSAGRSGLRYFQNALE